MFLKIIKYKGFIINFDLYPANWYGSLRNTGTVDVVINSVLKLSIHSSLGTIITVTGSNPWNPAYCTRRTRSGHFLTKHKNVYVYAYELILYSNPTLPVGLKLSYICSGGIWFGCVPPPWPHLPTLPLLPSAPGHQPQQVENKSGPAVFNLLFCE